MTCRVARSFHNSVSMDLVSCCGCDSTHLEALGALNTVGPYLCSICARSIVECGEAAPMRQATRNVAVQAPDGVSQEYTL
jgi:hypothetical protein